MPDTGSSPCPTQEAHHARHRMLTMPDTGCSPCQTQEALRDPQLWLCQNQRQNYKTPEITCLHFNHCSLELLAYCVLWNSTSNNPSHQLVQTWSPPSLCSVKWSTSNNPSHQLVQTGSLALNHLWQPQHSSCWLSAVVGKKPNKNRHFPIQSLRGRQKWTQLYLQDTSECSHCFSGKVLQQMVTCEVPASTLQCWRCLRFTESTRLPQKTNTWYRIRKRKSERSVSRKYP